MAEKYGFELTLPGQRPESPVPEYVTMEMLNGRHVNEGRTLTGNITDVASVPAIHKAINSIVTSNNQLPEVAPIGAMHELSNDRLAEFIDPVADTDYDPYGGRDPKRFLGIRRFVLSKTVRMASEKEKSTDNDMLTGFHLADTIQRAVPSVPSYPSAGALRKKGSVKTDSTSSVTEYYRDVKKLNDKGEIEVVRETPFRGTEAGTFVDADGRTIVVKNLGRETEFVESSRKQRKHADRLVKQRKKWRHAAHRAHDLHDTYKHVDHRDLQNMSRKNRRSYKSGQSKAHRAAEQEQNRRDIYVKTAYAPAQEHRKAASNRMRRQAKLDRVEAALASRP